MYCSVLYCIVLYYIGNRWKRWWCVYIFFEHHIVYERPKTLSANVKNVNTSAEVLKKCMKSPVINVRSLKSIGNSKSNKNHGESRLFKSMVYTSYDPIHTAISSWAISIVAISIVLDSIIHPNSRILQARIFCSKLVIRLFVKICYWCNTMGNSGTFKISLKVCTLT